MCDSYARSLLRVSVAQICQALGWDAVQLTACDLLSDVLDRYIQQLARGCHRYSELYGRTDPVLEDVGQAFRLLGVSLSELEDYVHNLEPVAFAQQTPLFPVSKNNMLQFPQLESQDKEERKEYIPDYMPPLVSFQEEEEEEGVLTDMGTSAEAMQVPLDEEEEDLGEEGVNDENYPIKRPMMSPDASTGMMPTSKRPRLEPGFSPEWAGEPREPLSSLNPQRVPSTMMDSAGSLPSSPETPALNIGFRPLPIMPRHSDHKAPCTPNRKPSVSSPGRQRIKSPKWSSVGPSAGSPISSPKAFPKEKRKSPGQAKSPKSSKMSKCGSEKAALTPGKDDSLQRTSHAILSEKMGKENVHVRQQALEPDRQMGEAHLRKPELPDNTIDDSIDAVIARACAEREPDPFAYNSASDSDSDCSSSPRRLAIMEPVTPKNKMGTNSITHQHCYDTSTPFSMSGVSGNMWTMDDSINEVIRRANQGGSSGTALDDSYLSSASASPPTPEPLLKVFEDKHKMVASADVKKKLKKELKTKLEKKEKEKPKMKDRERDKSKMKERNRDMSKDKKKEFPKETNIHWKEFSLREDVPREQFKMQDRVGSETSFKSKSKDGSFRKDKDRHKDKKKDKERSRKDKDKRDKGKDRGKEDKKLSAAHTPFSRVDVPLSLFSPSSCLRVPSMLPLIPAILSDRDVKGKEKDKKKDKKEKKKKKEKEKERERLREKEREKEEKKREKERERERREKEKEKEKEKERLKLEKVKVEPPPATPSPVIPRLTLRVGAQDKIVISKATPNAEVPKVQTPKTPNVKAVQPPAKVFSLPAPVLAPALPLAAAAPAAKTTPTTSTLSQGSSIKAPVCSVVTETVSAYVVRDEWGNKIWICPGCNKPDDGSPMIGCDGCDDWYHWPCVGLMAAPPEDVQWFCVKCAYKKKDKKHKKRKHKVQ